ncbi:hypothetical protein HUX88_08275 [Duganella sp. BJB1802]|uniref:hypothetical protein n=1 Tax=Duganella sp. BJB1802 TaxID=2744575 RepID=UPI001594362F|nr:hypothetical protein [Duganella sp. BJB1802]NVD70555.1 hypothetical protein [Duganella sp. BJB1802]
MPLKSLVAPLLAAAMLSGLAGCSRKETAPAAPAPASAPPATVAATPPPASDYAPLMQVVFGPAYRAAQDDAVADLPDPDQPGHKIHMALEAVDMERLPSGDTVLVVSGQHANAAGDADSAHVSSGYLSLYLLRQEGRQWKLVRRHDNVASLGSSGNIGELRWIELAAGKPGIAMLHGGVWQGYAITLLSLFDPAAMQVRDLAGAIPVHSDNEGGCGPSTKKCWQAEAAWRLAPAATPGGYDDLVLTFSGEERTARSAPASSDQNEDVERDVRPFNGSARYVYEQGAYHLREGVNPVPGI